MANPTTNFGWQMPTNTDLVKDLPADFEVFGQAVDTSLMDLKGGTTGQVLSKASNTDMDFTWVAQDDSNAIQNAIVDAKGDLITATANDTPARLAVGTNGQVLTADSTQSTGLAWTTISSGGITLLSTTTLSGTSTTISSISQSYTNLFITYYGITLSTADIVRFKLNNDSGGNYTYQRSSGSTTSTLGSNTYIDAFSSAANQSTTSTNNSGILRVWNYTSTFPKPFEVVGTNISSASADLTMTGSGYWKNTSAMTSFVIYSNGGATFNAGTVLIYGVK
jgi:hypothetical protein